MRFILLLTLLCSGFWAMAQSCDFTLNGTVIDLHDGTPLSGATVIVAGTEEAVLTDFDGSFTLGGLCDETYSLQISHPECSTRGFSVRVNENTTRTFRLEHHLESLDEVMITAQGYRTKVETLAENTIDLETIERQSNASLGDVLNTLSGVSTFSTGNAVVKPVINGLHSSRVTIINNGVRMEDQEWGAEHAPNIDVNTANSISVLKGASALQYSGDAIGGIVIAEPRAVPLSDSLFGKTIASFSSNGRGGSLTSQLTKSSGDGWFTTLQGSLKRYGDFEAPGYVLSNTGLSERAISLRVGLNKISYGFEGYYSFFSNTIGILRASHLGGAGDQVAAIESDEPLVIEPFTYEIDRPKQEVTHHTARFSGFKQIEGFGKIDAQYNFQYNQRFEFDIRRGDDADKPSVDLQLTTHRADVNMLWNERENTSVKAGITGMWQNNFADPDTGVRRLIPDYDEYNLGVYAIGEYEVSPQWTLELGGRFDYTFMDVDKFYRTSFWEARGYDEEFPELVVGEFGNQILTNPQLTFNNLSATAGTAYRFGNGLSILANYSFASRAPNPSELFSEGLHHSASRIELGDLRFTSEQAQKITLTLQRTSVGITFAVNPYVNFIEDFILIEPTGIRQTIRGNFQVWEYRQTAARLVGLDVDAQTGLTDWLDYQFQFSIVKGNDVDRERPLINMPPPRLRNGVSGSFLKEGQLRLGLQSEYVFRQNEFPNNNFEVFLPEQENDVLVDISTPPDAYHLIHFNGSYAFSIGSNSTAQVGLDVMNVFNTEYRDYLNRLRFYADDQGRNILLSLKINY
ncbi:TonB-dependent receptor [Altibacter sp. HG106]|uniref:TonB-dependent receptor n=1 Tax=Altibacter sp. HG106 TaxID=3023937 RepID=UPI00235020CA|nr:TonB-dependent receptor [Altibacter sp. HG106]MDC7993646.1 TonB-dependent receptor [Altibacter sp. HG106]